MDDNYYARSQNNILDDDDDTVTKDTANFIIAFFVIGFILTFSIITFLLIIYYNTKQWDNKLENLSDFNKANKYTQAKIFSVTFTMSVFNVYAIALDGFALHTYETMKPDIHKPEILSKLPPIVAAVDSLGFIFWMMCCVTGLCLFAIGKKKEKKEL